MEVSKKNLTVLVMPTKKTSDILVTISFPFEVSKEYLKQLMCNCFAHPAELKENVENTALAFALFETIRDKITGSVLEMSKTKVSNISCYTTGSNFSIKWNCQGSITNFRKTCNIAVSCLNPIKLYAKYTENIKVLTSKGAKKEEFNYCVRKMVESLKDIKIVAVGKININQEKLQDVFDTVFSKVPSAEVPPSKGTSIEKHPKHEQKYPVIKCNDISAPILADYLKLNAAGISIEVTSQGIVILNTAESKLSALKDKQRIKDYIVRKCEKLGDEFLPLLVYFSISQNFADAMTATKMIKQKITPKKVEEILIKHLI